MSSVSETTGPSGISIRVSTVIDAPIGEVWDDVRHIARHVEWMKDAVSIQFHDGPGESGARGQADGPAREGVREGVGVRFSCRTKVGPIVLNDHMEITEWIDGRLIGIRHRGLVTGEGQLRLAPLDQAQTEVVWEERLVFPARLGGPIGTRLARPVLRRIWTGNLSRLSARFKPPG